MKRTKFATIRRIFLKSVAGASLAVASVGLGQDDQTLLDRARPVTKIKLGLDNFSVRAMGWKAPALVDYAASLKTDSLFITDLDAFESFDESYLKDLKSKAADQGRRIHVGTWSICPTSKYFKNRWGTAEEHLALGIRIAKALGSPVIRVIPGMVEDHKSEGGIEARTVGTVKVCQSQRSRALDAGVKIAVENHGGDMQAWDIETISGFNREIHYLNDDFWKVWPKSRAKDFAKFLAPAERSKPREAHKSADAKAEQDNQKSELERSLKYYKEVLGLGLKT